MAKNPPRVLLDTNVLISAHVFGGKPQKIYDLVIEGKIIAITSPVLISELVETLAKKFNFETRRIDQFERIIKKNFKKVHPSTTLNITEDKDDNRVLEAAIEGRCQYIVTGDKELLELGEYKKISILTPAEFLERMQ